jgi:hypothetical protein
MFGSTHNYHSKLFFIQSFVVNSIKFWLPKIPIELLFRGHGQNPFTQKLEMFRFLTLLRSMCTVH